MPRAPHLVRIAVHEAGHAVVAHHFGGTFTGPLIYYAPREGKVDGFGYADKCYLPREATPPQHAAWYMGTVPRRSRRARWPTDRAQGPHPLLRVCVGHPRARCLRGVPGARSGHGGAR
jgi:hypothetical protein